MLCETCVICERDFFNEPQRTQMKRRRDAIISSISEVRELSHMSIKLTKGERFNLSQKVPNFQKLAIALGWQVSQTSQNCDIDCSVFMLAADGRIPDEKYFVFYNNLTSPDCSVRHSGDSTTGQIEGDDETIYINLSKINSAIQEIVFIVTLHQGQEKNQSFSQVTNAFIRLYNQETVSELVRYNLNQIFSQETALEFGRLYKKNGDWRFQAVGQGYNAGLPSFVDKYYVKNAVEKSLNAGEKVDDAEILRQFSDRVDKQLREEAVSSEAVEQPVATPVKADTVESDKKEKIDDSALENLEPAISAEEFLQRYEDGERDFTGINLAGVNLSGKSLIRVNFNLANLQEANLSLTDMNNAELSQANLSGANLTKANLQSAKLLQANLNKTKLNEANLNAANLTAANLLGANLMQANLLYANLTVAELSEANLKNAQTKGANFSGANLRKINLVGGILQCNLSGAILIEGNLCGANLSEGNFSGANLTSADLCGANLNKTNLEKANLKGANLSGVINLAWAKLTGAIMPDGTTHE